MGQDGTRVRFPLSPEQLEEIYLPKIRGSELLRAHVEHYDRLVGGHPDRCYRFLSTMTDKTIRDTRQRLNQDALTHSVAGTKKAGAPATQGNPQQQQQAPGGTPQQHVGAPGTKGDSKGKKGKGKGCDTTDPQAGTAGTTPKGKGKGKDAGDATFEKSCLLFYFGKC